MRERNDTTPPGVPGEVHPTPTPRTRRHTRQDHIPLGSQVTVTTSGGRTFTGHVYRIEQSGTRTMLSVCGAEDTLSAAE